MSTELRVPSMGESITEVQIATWQKAEGDAIAKDEAVVSLESEKAALDLPAPVAGTLARILKKNGEMVKVGEVIGQIEEKSAAPAKPAGIKKAPDQTGAVTAPKAPPADAVNEDKPKTESETTKEKTPPATEPVKHNGLPTHKTPDSAPRVMPSARGLLAKHGLQAEEIKATGRGGRVLKADVQHHIEETKSQNPPAQPSEAASESERETEVVPMSLLRRTVARRLVEAQHTAALLTTINEIDLTAVMELRKSLGELFQKQHGVRLGLMSFFVKATIEALKLIPQLNAEIRETNVVYHNYFDIGIAVSSEKGLVVPVLSNAERLSFAEIEKAIADFAQRAQARTLTPEELQGGTFTITNGGVFGSLLSTPIVNPPQSGVLGMHTIQERPVARDGVVVIRPMMYVALTYDHRIVDGREAVLFLRRIKEVIEQPNRMLIEA